MHTARFLFESWGTLKPLVMAAIHAVLHLLGSSGGPQIN